MLQATSKAFCIYSASVLFFLRVTTLLAGVWYMSHQLLPSLLSVCVCSSQSEDAHLICLRPTYKLCLTMHLVHTNRAPQYLSDCVQTVSRSNIVDLVWDSPTHPPTPSRGVEPGSESAASVTPDSLLGTVFQTTSIKSVTLAFSSVALKLNYFVEHTFASFC